ncbi:MAG: single-stranded-DNA-specific exonuclease RecJ [Acutalibacteraceae bacterium]|nr:single-stranded-DNA-specific exonuclease RecJ [Acutalibacteraceae bacterium]
MKKWELSHIDKDYAKELAAECDIDPFVAYIAASRGYDNPELLEEFLSDEPIFADPYELTDMDKAVECIRNAIDEKLIIAVYGDYDCDGVTATALLYSYLVSCGATVIYHIPDRFSEGYGMNIPAIENLHKQGVGLIITVDNGISCKEEIEYAKTLGMRVVVTDHHLPPDEIPDCEAVVDPHRKDDFSEFKDVCGVGVAFKLVCALEDASPEEFISVYGDFVALGTIADVMPLINENRSFVKCGFSAIKHSKKEGIKALLKVSGFDKGKFNLSRISFGLVPRINAAGRMGSADRAFELLISSDSEEAMKLAEEINLENSTRQEIEKEILEEAENIISAQCLMYDRVIVVAGEDWHHGIVGIVASRICERYGKPAIVLSIDGQLAHGSGRSIEGFSLYEAINYASSCTEKFGGHEQAAGVTVKKEDIASFRKAVNDYAHTKEPVMPVLKLDCKLNPAALNIDLVYALEALQPFGSGNPIPLFCISSVQIEKITPVGNGKHLKIQFIKGAVAFQAMLFSCSEEDFLFEKGDVIDIAVVLETNVYNGKEFLSIQIKDYRYAGINDSSLAVQISAYDDFVRRVNKNYNEFSPTREQCGTVYKFILKKERMYESVIQRFTDSIGLTKTKIIIDALIELQLVESCYKKGNRRLTVINLGNKVNLDNSDILKRVRGEING